MVCSVKGIPYKNEDFWFCHHPTMSPEPGDVTSWDHIFWRSEPRRQVLSFLGIWSLGVHRDAPEDCPAPLNITFTVNSYPNPNPSMEITETDNRTSPPWDAHATEAGSWRQTIVSFQGRSSQLKWKDSMGIGNIGSYRFLSQETRDSVDVSFNN